MQSVRLLARRVHPKVFRKAFRPSFQQAPKEAQKYDFGDDNSNNEEDFLSSAQEIEALFRSMDTNGNGELDKDELATALRKGKLPTSREHLDKLFQEMDTNKSGAIDLEEFTVFVQERKQKLHRAYHWILQHNNNLTSTENPHKGFTARTLRVAAKRCGVHLSDADVELIWSKLDANGDNHISYPEFVSCLLLAPEINPRYFLDSWYTDAFCDDAESQFTIPREIRVDENDDDDLDTTVSFGQVVAKKLACGGIAGAISRTFTAPMDRIRVLMMTASGGTNEAMGVRGALTTATKNGGYARLWMGNGVNCLKIGPEMGIKLMAFDVLKDKIAKDPSNVTVAERFAAGGAAGVVAQVAIYPMEVIKTRLAVTTQAKPPSMTECIKRTFSEGGHRAFYAGVGPSIVGILPYAAIDLSLNSMLRDYAANYLEQTKQETNVPVLLGCGMVSSGLAAVMTFPLNVIRTNAQATGDSFARIVQALQAQGWRSFYRGLVPCLGKVLPATSISYAAYEYLGGEWDQNMRASRHLSVGIGYPTTAAVRSRDMKFPTRPKSFPARKPPGIHKTLYARRFEAVDAMN